MTMSGARVMGDAMAVGAGQGVDLEKNARQRASL